MSIVASICVKPNIRNCFVELSNSLARECSRGFQGTIGIPPTVCLEDSSQKQYFVSWSPHKGDLNQIDSNIIYIGKHFADAIKLCNADMVYVSPVTSAQPCEQVFVAPVNSEEYEIIELNSQNIEQNLLNQIRIVSPGLTFPMFLRGSAVVLLKIESMVPNTSLAYLEEFSELHIALALSRNTKEITGEASQEQVRTSAVQKIPLTQKESKTVAKNYRRRKKNSDTAENQKGFDIWSYVADYFGVKYPENSVIDTSSKQASRSIQNQRDKNSTVPHIHSEQHFEKLLRVYPISSQSQYGFQPFQAFVDKEIFKSLCACSAVDDVPLANRIPVQLFRIKSPTERAFEKKKGKEKDIVFIKNESAVVEICCSDSESEGFTILPKNIAISTELLQFLQLQQGMIVRIKCLHQKPSIPVGVVLTLLEKEGPSLTNESVSELFQSWIKEKCSSCSTGIILNDGVTLDISPDSAATVLVSVSILAAKKELRTGPTYFRIDESTLGNLSIVIKEEYFKNSTSETALESTLKNLRGVPRSLSFPPVKLGGIEDYLEKAKRYLVNILDSRQQFGSIRNEMERLKGALLICGGSRSVAGGSGRSSFARALCGSCERPPYFAHTEFINCTELRGKKPENIISRFSTAFEEARWRQPAVLVLDDLDNLIFQPDPVKDAEPTIVYQSRLAEGLKDILREEMEMSNRVALIIISKSKDSLHEVFSSASGWHFVCDSLVLAPPELEKREEIIKVLIETTGCRLRDNEFARRIAARTEGFLPADLNAIVKRAKHHALRNFKSKDQEVKLSEDSFEDALCGYKPLGLHGIDLHKPGDYGWKDVGGLGQAKKILQETFIWPIKHPSLFSKCRLRMRSGVLLYGPPGTGKTLLAGVIAKECGMNFVSIKGPELLSKYVGSSEQNVRDLFARAQSASPCILFFDEFDSLAPKRGHDNTGVTDRVVNQLLTQLDGVEKLDKVFVLAATSRPDLIDPALLRPGRLDKCVFCAMPNTNERLEILKTLSQSLDIEDEIDFDSISDKTVGFSGADIKALLYNAQLKSIHRNYPSVRLYDHDDEQEASVQVQESSSALKITKNDMVEALADTSSSVTLSEKKRYERIYENFMALRKGSTQQNETDQRVTLA